MKKNYFTIIALSIILVFALGLSQDIEHRVKILEMRLDSLIATLSGQSQPIVHGDTFFDESNVLFGIIGTRGIILNKNYYVNNYNNVWKIPYWVAYYTDSVLLKGNTARTDNWRSDPELPAESRSELEDYRNSGYDRGHNAPAADFKRSQEAMSTTFLLSNACPQTQHLNQQIWERLESQVRDMIKMIGKAWIITGNLFLNTDSQVISSTNIIGNHVAIPTHCFKIILLYNQTMDTYSMYAFMMPNALDQIPGRPADYLLSTDQLERISGYDFFNRLPDDLENRLESAIPSNWPR